MKWTHVAVAVVGLRPIDTIRYHASRSVEVNARHPEIFFVFVPNSEICASINNYDTGAKFGVCWFNSRIAQPAMHTARWAPTFWALLQIRAKAFSCSLTRNLREGMPSLQGTGMVNRVKTCIFRTVMAVTAVPSYYTRIQGLNWSLKALIYVLETAAYFKTRKDFAHGILFFCECYC